MRIKHKFTFVILTAIAVFLFSALYPYAIKSAIINPKGIIALQERDIIYLATILMLIIVIPVLVMTFVICLRYRSTNKEAKYTPNWSHSALAETIWWGFPCVIVLSLSIVAWKTSHELDPFKPLEHENKALNIQVVALEWKWLFIYPEQKIASVNFFQFPENTPLIFEITADAPMNSFWIPELGGQIYAMPGMTTKLHLISNATGTFRGSSANLSGTGFAGMTFFAKSSSAEDFEKWVASVQESKDRLGLEEYHQLVKPSEYNPVQPFVLEEENLFHQIIMQYMQPAEKTQMENK